MNVSIEEVVRIVIVILPILSSLIVMKMRNSKNLKWRTRAEQWNRISKEVQSYIPLAEEYVNYTGKDKKQYVLTKVNQFCINNNIPYEDDKATEILEHIISLTKKVNKRV